MKRKHILHTNFEIKSSEIKEQGEGNFGFFEGYASVFDVVDSYGDIVKKGAFTTSIKSKKTMPMLYQHSATEVIGSFYELKEDDAGLFVRGRINLDVAKAKETYSLLKAGDISSMSIGYRTTDTDTDKNGSRLIKALDLVEISIVTFPANTSAVVTQVKSLDDILTRDEFIAHLMLKGVDGLESEAIFTKVKEILHNEEIQAKADAEAEYKKIEVEILQDLIKKIKTN